MKRTLLALLVGLSLLLSLAACGSERASAQEVTEQGLAALRDLDVLALPQYWNTDGLNLDDLGDLTQAGEEVDLSAEDTAALAQAMTRHLSWQVISAQEDPGAGTASVTVSLTNLDMAPVVGQFLQEAFSDALSSALQADGQQPTEEEMTQQYLQTLTDLLNQEDLDTRTTTVEVPLTLVDGQWKITPDEAVVDALLGGLLTTGEALTSLLEESAPDRLSPPRPANGPSPGGEGPFRFLDRAKARRLGGAPWASGPVSSSCCGCSWPHRAPPPSRAGCWEGRTPPQGSGSGGRSRRDPRPRPRPRRRTPGWACSSRTWG